MVSPIEASANLNVASSLRQAAPSLRCYRLRLLNEADDLHHQQELPDRLLKWLTDKTLV